MDGLTWNREHHQEGSMSFLVSLCGMYNHLRARGHPTDQLGEAGTITSVPGTHRRLRGSSPGGRLETRMLGQVVYLGSDNDTGKEVGR